MHTKTEQMNTQSYNKFMKNFEKLQTKGASALVIIKLCLHNKHYKLY